MSTNSILSKIRQEIERRMKIYKESNYGISLRYQELEELLSFLDTLSEEPDIPEFPETFEICLYDSRTPDNEKCTECSTTCSVRKEEPDKNLEEAAEEKYPVFWKSYPKDGIVRSESSYDTNKQCRDAFIAGAEWQASQMPMPEDTVLFQKGVAEGRRLEREDMLKEAVEVDLEKEITRFLSNATKMNKGEWRGKYAISEIGFRAVAHHFYELDKNSK